MTLSLPRIVTLTLNPALDLSTETAHVAPGPKLRCAPPRIDPGGGGVNVSRALAILGGDSLPLVAAGGPVGAQLIALLRAQGLAPEALGVERPTRQSLSVRDLSTGAQFRFVLPGPDWTEADIAATRARIVAAARPGDLLVASGSQPGGAPDAFFPELNDALAPRGCAMILDTSGAALAAAIGRAGAALHTLRMDGEEAVAAAGRPLPTLADVAAFAALLRDRGVAATVAVGVGAEGTALACAEGRFVCRPPKVVVVSAVGAGDSFVAGYALAVSRGATAADACAWGVAAAASAVETPDTRLCERAAVEAYRVQVVIQEV